METLVIDRAQHLTGNAFKHLCISGLRPPEAKGLMCCQGFYCKALGLTDDQIMGHSSLPSLGTLAPAETHWMRERVAEKDRISPSDITVSDAIITANDDFKAHPSRREARIKKLFRKYGKIDVQFVGSSRTATETAKKAVNRE